MSVLPQLFTRNWRLKLSALGLSIFLWAIVTVQPRNRHILQAVPVQVVVNDPAWVLADLPSPPTVTVHLGGPMRDLPRSGELAVVRVPIDLVTSGDTLIRLRPDWVVLGGGGGMVETISPGFVTVRLEPKQSRVVPLSLRLRGELPDHVALAQPLGLSPPVVRVLGPSRLVDALDSIPLEPLDLSGLTESGSHTVRVDTFGLGGVVVETTAAQISVLLQPSAQRAVASVPVVVEVPPNVDPATLVVDPVTIPLTLRGAVTLVNQADVEALSAVVAASDLEGIPAGAQWIVPIRIRGAPPLVRAFSAVDSVRVLRTLAVTRPGDVPRPDTAQSAEPNAPIAGASSRGVSAPAARGAARWGPGGER